MYFKKSLGQHILASKSALQDIVGALAPTKNDVVLEIGAGPGNLTRLLAESGAHVIAVEKDARMIEKLKTQSSKLKGVEIIHADFLRLDLRSLLSLPLVRGGLGWGHEPRATSDERRLFAGNIPYNISTPILFKLRDNRDLFNRGVLTLQREVAERLAAGPGTKDYGILSIAIQLVAKARLLFDIPPHAFIPPPRVTSSVVEIIFPKPPPYTVDDETSFLNLVKKAFGKRRKTLKNALLPAYGPASRIEGALGELPKTVRAEELTIGELINLWKILSSNPIDNAR